MVEDFLVIDGTKLATMLAWDHFRREYEDTMKFNDLYEQVDDSGNWYLNSDMQLVFDGIEEQYREKILQFDATSLI